MLSNNPKTPLVGDEDAIVNWPEIQRLIESLPEVEREVIRMNIAAIFLHGNPTWTINDLPQFLHPKNRIGECFSEIMKKST